MENSISRPLFYMCVACMLSYFPELLEMMMQPGVAPAISSTSIGLFYQQLQPLISFVQPATSLGAMVFGIKSLIAFQHVAQGGSYEEKTVKPVNKEPVDTLRELPAPIPRKPLPGSEPLDFQDPELNSRVDRLMTKASELNQLQLLNDLPESQVFVQNLEAQYLMPIWRTYLSFPKDIYQGPMQARKQAGNQLEKLENRVQEVEKAALEQLVKQQEVNRRFLDNKLATMQ